MDASRRHVRRHDRPPVRERRPCRLLDHHVPAERSPAPAYRQRRNRQDLASVLPSRTRRRGRRLRQRALRRPRAGALRRVGLIQSNS